MTNTLISRYHKARSKAAWFHLEDWSVAAVVGQDARDFLQRLGTADLRPLTPGNGAQTLFLKGDGRLIAECAVLCRDSDDFLLVMPEVCREALLEALDRFHFTEKLTISDHRTKYHVGFLAGPARADIMAGVAGTSPDVLADVVAADVTFAPQASRLMLVIPEENFSRVTHALYEVLEQREAVIGDMDLLRVIQMEDGVPKFGVDTTERTIPLEAGQKSSISFTKGCFPGQEIVARINNLGHPARVLVGLVLPETTSDLVGRKLLFEGKETGQITSVAFSPALGGMLGLAYVRWNQREEGTVVDIDGDGQYRATVVELPLKQVRA